MNSAHGPCACAARYLKRREMNFPGSFFGPRPAWLPFGRRLETLSGFDHRSLLTCRAFYVGFAGFHPESTRGFGVEYCRCCRGSPIALRTAVAVAERGHDAPRPGTDFFENTNFRDLSF